MDTCLSNIISFVIVFKQYDYFTIISYKISKFISIFFKFVPFMRLYTVIQGYFIFELSGLLNAEYRSTRSQYFIEKPQNQTLNEGETTMLQCQVGNLQGVVQWTRNGFAMGKSYHYSSKYLSNNSNN